MAVNHYAKGYRAERELKQMLLAQGFQVVRSGGSGTDGVSPDLLALKASKKFALECKARSSDYLHIEKPKWELMKSWEETTGLPVIIAWKIDRREWRFFPLLAMKDSGKSYSLNKKEYGNGMEFGEVIKTR
ncbi:hypothetical protein HY993_00335 [Candidatus Micrarchaeota archaeon]|nr:hypothetical protein [Candidatus Micrarchaeota archaeon]